MTRKASVTIISGKGSERHNHDKTYRSTLQHVFPYEENTEYTPLCPYKEQINRIMEPYIKQYNAREQQKYEKRLLAYKARKTKDKPKLKQRSLDYYDDVQREARRNPMNGKMQSRQPFLSLIIMFGNVADRVLGTIRQEEAKEIGYDVTCGFADAFPGFHLLGSSLHLDEMGAFHLHIDFVVACKKMNWTHDLPVYTNFDRALLEMGYAKEPNRYPGKEEAAPTIFNAYRNILLYVIQAAMAKQGIELDYGVSLLRYPGKDPSSRWTQAKYKETVTFQNTLADYRNQMIARLERPDMKVRDLDSALKVMLSIRDLAAGQHEVQQSAYIHGYEVTSELLERYVDSCTVVCASLLGKIRNLQDSVDSLAEELELQQAENYSLFAEKDRLTMEIKAMEHRLNKLQRQEKALMTAQEVEELPESKLLAVPHLTAKKYNKLKKTAEWALELEKLLEETKKREQELAAEKEVYRRLMEEYYRKINEDYGNSAEAIHERLEDRAGLPGMIRKLELELVRADFNQGQLRGIADKIEMARAELSVISNKLRDKAQDLER